MARGRRPQLAVGVTGPQLAHRLQLQRADDPLAVGRRDRLRRPRRVTRQLRVQRLGAELLHPLPPALPHARVRRRRQAERRQRGPQVQAGAPDDDRSHAIAQRLVDLGVGELREATDAERLAAPAPPRSAGARAARAGAPSRRRSASAGRRRPAARPRRSRPVARRALAAGRRARSRPRSCRRRSGRTARSPRLRPSAQYRREMSRGGNA